MLTVLGWQRMDAAAMAAAVAQRGNRDTRAAEALAMKDEQLRILGEQNGKLLASLNAMDDELQTLKATKLRLEDDNRSLRDLNFELQSKARAAETALTKAQAGVEERDTQLRVLTDHNTELLRLLEHEEAQAASLATSNAAQQRDLEALHTRLTSVMASAKIHEEVATRATREGQLRAEEVRLLRNESDQLRACNAELKMKTQVELEALQEQLRVRKEKQYQLLEKMQQLDEAKRRGDDQLAALEDKLRASLERGQELETQVQLEAKAKRAQLDANKGLFIENGNLMRDKQELQQRADRAEQERARMEAENRDSAEQLREMAEKVFQLLERLKLAELGKTKALDGLKTKELELLALKKKNARLLKEGTSEGKARAKSEMDKKVLLEQLQALKKHNAQLSVRCSDEVKAKLKESDERKVLEDKLQTMGARVAFLLNKMQADEEAKLATKEELKKLGAQVASAQDKGSELAAKLHATAESNRVVTEALRTKQGELDEAKIRFEASQKKAAALATALENAGLSLNGDDNGRNSSNNNQQDSPIHPDDAAAVASNARFFVESRASHGGLLVIKAKRLVSTATNSSSSQPDPVLIQQQQRNAALLDRMSINAFLKRAQKSMNTKQVLVERLAALLGALAAGEDAAAEAEKQLEARRDQIAHLARKAARLQEKLSVEEDAKRKTLLRYVHEIKARSGVTDNGVLKLSESGVADEEVHAIAALLRSNAVGVRELQLRGNSISNEGARAVAAVLANAACGLRLVDLRCNFITKDGVKVLAEALERHPRTKHVYVHAGGKIEALGTTSSESLTSVAGLSVTMATPSPGVSTIGVETVCVVDVRDQKESDDPNSALQFAADLDDGLELTTNATAVAGPGSAFKLKMASLGTATATNDDRDSSSRLFAKRPLSAATLKKQREKLAAQRRKKLEETRALAKKEAEWSGRAGGIDSSPSPLDSAKKLPPIGGSGGSSNITSVSRTSSAPVLKKKGDDDGPEDAK